MIVHKCRFVASILAAALAGLGCDSASSTQPAPGNSLIGEWSGTMIDKAAGSGALTVRLTAGKVIGVEGTWSVMFPASAGSDGGSISAASSVSAVPFFAFSCHEIGPGGIPGSGGFDAILRDNRLAGSYVVFGCGALGGGTIELTKQ